MFTTALLTSPGGRDHNEDSCVILENGGSLCALVADGLGGHLGGAAASEAAVAGAREKFDAGGDIGAILDAANQAVLRRQQKEPKLRQMRTTLVALLAQTDGLAWWAHAGDSRLYLFRQYKVAARTADHSVPQKLVEAGQISPSQIRFHEDRNVLLRTLGSKSDHGATVTSKPAVLEPGDAFVLCSDGFWEWIEESEMESAWRAAGTPQQWLATMEAVLRTRAEPGFDNYSAIAVLVGGNSVSPGAPEPVV